MGHKLIYMKQKNEVIQWDILILFNIFKDGVKNFHPWDRLKMVKSTLSSTTEHVVPHDTDHAPHEYDNEEERGILMHVYFDTKGQ